MNLMAMLKNSMHNFMDLLVENILPLEFDITYTNILMSEVANHLLIHLSDINTDTNDPPEVISSYH